jgi:hypothetical protein
MHKSGARKRGVAEKVLEYRLRAEQCDAQADGANNPAIKVLMRNLAQQWLELATFRQPMYHRNKQSHR